MLKNSSRPFIVYLISKNLTIRCQVILYEIENTNRFPRVQDFASYSRLVKCSKESNGKKYGSSGKKIGNAHLKWAFSEAAALFLKGNEPGKRYRERLMNKHGKAKSLSILAHRMGQALYFMLKNKKLFDQDNSWGFKVEGDGSA